MLDIAHLYHLGPRDIDTLTLHEWEYFKAGVEQVRKANREAGRG